jgi:hypothetical protein
MLLIRLWKRDGLDWPVTVDAAALQIARSPGALAGGKGRDEIELRLRRGEVLDSACAVFGPDYETAESWRLRLAAGAGL